jgi:hypothetical protein
MHRHFVNEPSLRLARETHHDLPQNSPEDASITLYFTTTSV